jgi:Ca-activated chloride channel family protein
MTAQLDRRYLPESGGGEVYLQIDLAADTDPGARRRVPVNAVLILDRSGSMAGAKMDRARDAARALVQALGPEDRLAIVEFSSDAHLALPSIPLTRSARQTALAAIDDIEPGGGTNMSAGFDLAAHELSRGHLAGRVDKVFLASDGQANEGISDRAGLLRLAQGDFAGATVSTFGMGDDYDENFMTALAARAGGRARYIDSPEILPGAFRHELSRASSMVARNVRVHVNAVSGASVERVLGYETEGGWVRLPDFAAGEERRVLVKLSVPPGRGLTDLAAVELRFDEAAGGGKFSQASAQATFTSDSSLLAQAPTDAAVQGAKAEMADLALQAARLQEEGRRAEAQAQMMKLRQVAGKAAPASPAVMAQASEYERDVSAIGAPGSAASKKLKERAFDVVRAPVAGW